MVYIKNKQKDYFYIHETQLDRCLMKENTGTTTEDSMSQDGSVGVEMVSANDTVSTENAQLNSVIKVQSLIRKYLTQKRYRFNQLPKDQMTEYMAFLLGNDPNIEGLNHHAPKEGGVALVATSALRAIKIACELSVKDRSVTPRIFIVDNSQKVHDAWTSLKKSAEQSSAPEFFEQLSQYLIQEENKGYRAFKKYSCECADSQTHPPQDPFKFWGELIDLYTYDYLQKLIANTICIKQSFADAASFIKIKNHIQDLGIKNTFVYASNILCDIYWTALQYRPLVNVILENIELLEPKLAIHTDICRKHWEPKRFFLIDNQAPAHVRQILKLGKPSASVQPPLNNAQPDSQEEGNQLTRSNLEQ
ncbi:hypothetical protein EAS68_02925 [Legionella jordanis]|nr:hypothetical protein EAS68_02925 [Legionella jordanis]